MKRKTDKPRERQEGEYEKGQGKRSVKRKYEGNVGHPQEISGRQVKGKEETEDNSLSHTKQKWTGGSDLRGRRERKKVAEISHLDSSKAASRCSHMKQSRVKILTKRPQGEIKGTFTMDMKLFHYSIH